MQSCEVASLAWCESVAASDGPSDEGITYRNGQDWVGPAESVPEDLGNTEALLKWAQVWESHSYSIGDWAGDGSGSWVDSIEADGTVIVVSADDYFAKRDKSTRIRLGT